VVTELAGEPGGQHGAEQGSAVLRLEGWRDLPDALAQRLVARAWTRTGGGRDLSRTHIERIVAFLVEPERHDGGKRLELPGGLVLVRETKRFRLLRAASSGPDSRAS